MTDHARDVQHAWDMLRLCAAGIRPTTISIDPQPSEIESVGGDLRTLARHVDRLISVYGRMLAAHVPIDLSLFEDVLTRAIDGDALYEIQCAADDLRSDQREASYYAEHSREAAE